MYNYHEVCHSINDCIVCDILPVVNLIVADSAVLLVRNADIERTVAVHMYSPDCSLPNDLTVTVLV